MEIQLPVEEERCRSLLRKTVQRLKDIGPYSQRDIAKKASALSPGYSLPEPTLTNLLKEDSKVRRATLREATKHILQVLYEEYGMVFDEAQDDFVKLQNSDWQKRVIQDNPLKGFELYPEGRLSVPDKIELIESAQKEIIEVGIRLHTFSSDFSKTNDASYRGKIEALLAKGVHFKSYMLDPFSSEAGHYFDDRSKVIKKEQNAREEAKEALENLKTVAAEFKAANYKGRFELYTYRHYPQNLFISVDRTEPDGQILVSPYLYGIRRAECPVFVVRNGLQLALFRKYRQSLEYFIQDAIPVVLGE
jgi:Domain of unknown function (DUF5919)